MRDCLFCRIASGDQQADIVHESDDLVAFRDINPAAPTHILIIPKEHIDSVRAIRGRHAKMLAELFQTASHLARAEGVDDGGWRVVTNVGAGAGQSVQHLHFHLLGGRHMSWPPG